MKGLTKKQRNFIKFIKKFNLKMKMAPTVYELADEFEIKTSTVFAHLIALQKKGFITRSSKARSIALTELADDNKNNSDSHVIEIPLVGRIAAGMPVDSPEYNEGSITCDSRNFRGDLNKLFALKINGESMREVGILDGDVVVVQQTHSVRRGDIVVAMVGNETTVKSFFPAPDARVELRPANGDFTSQFYPIESVSIQGKVVSLQRQY